MSKTRDAEEGHVTVCVRSRPLNEREKRLGSPICLQFQNGNMVSIYKSSVPAGGSSDVSGDANGARTFSFDRAFNSNDSQIAVYEYLGLPVLRASLNGFNTCVFAYGQSGSGKSYSMMGPSGGRDVVVDPGIIPRLSKGLFKMMEEKLAENERERGEALAAGVEEHMLPPELSITVLVSYMEIYQERVNCLLNSKLENLKVREHKALGVYVEGITEMQVTSEENMMNVMHGGNQSRHIAATNMNERSSRSHAIFSITVVQKRKGKAKDGSVACTELRAKVNLVDLAGSERAKSTGAEGGTLREGANINKSLTVLGQVISALADMGKSKGENLARKHVPYRDSTLTFILKESLGGNSKTFMLSTLSPAAANYDETLSTLRYADRAKSIVTRAVVNAAAGDKRIRELEEEVQQLREKMKHYEELARRGGANPDASQPFTGRGLFTSESHQKYSAEDLDESFPSFTPRRPQDALQMQNKLRQAEQLMKHLEELEASPKELPRPAHPTIKLDRNEPFVLNVDGVGDWVVEHLLPGLTYLGTEEATPGSEWRNMTVSGEATGGVAPRHCCFVRQGNGAVLLRPIDGNPTYINDEPNPISMDVMLVSGTVVLIGDEYLQFKFTDPSAPPMTARRRPMRTSENLVLSPRRQLPTSRINPNSVSPPPPADTASPPAHAERNVGGSTVPSFVPPLNLATKASAGGGSDPTTVPPLQFPTQASVPTPAAAATAKARAGSTSFTVSTGALSGGNNAATPVVPMLRLGEVLQLQDQCATDRPLHCKGPTRSDIRPMSVRLSRPPNAACKGRDSVLARGGRVQAARTARGEASEEQEDFSAVYRHTFLSVGYSRCGKSAFRENLQKQSKWYDSIFTNDLKHLRSTFGVDSITVSTTGSYQSVEMNLMELGGAGCFSLLQGLLPTRRVTFVVCFSLRGDFSFEHLMPFLQFILCQTTSRDTTVILIGTHLDRSPIKADKLALFFLDIEKQVSNYFRILQPVTEKRPAIVGSFAVDNVNRTVFSPLFGRLKKFPELLSWLGDQAIQRCRNDSDFPNAQVPRRLLSLCKKTRELNREGKWCISSLEFKTIARVIDSRYGNNVEDLHRHMQLLMSWGVLHHHYRHHSMKKYVVVDTPWVLRAVAVLSCCTSVVPEFSGSVAERRPMPLVLCRDVMQSMQGSLPFDGDDVLTSDVCGVLLQGVVTMRTAMALFRGVLKEKDYSANQLGGLLELLRSYDLIIMGSRLQYSSFYGNASVESVDGNASDINRASSPSPQPRWQSQRCDVDGKDARGSYSRSRKSRSSCSPCGFQSEQFIIIPACFMHQTPSVLSMHLPTLLGGPFYRFTLDMVPHNFFARITCRVAHCAEKVYLGPVSSRRVPLEDLLESSGTDDATKRAYSCGSPCGNGSVPVADSESDMLSEPVPTACFVNTSQFWDSTMWVVSNSRSRALLRMVQRSLFITFHDLDNNTAFYDGVRHVVRSIVGESPGVACRESIMCARRYLEEDEKSEEIYGDGVYWRDVDENINSLEKIKNREASALMTARGLTPRLPTDNRGRGAKLGSSSPTRANHKADGDQSRDDEEIIPFMRDLSGPIDVDSLVQRISADAQSGDALLGEVRGALRAMKEAREGDNPAGECRALDWLVDVLAQA